MPKLPELRLPALPTPLPVRRRATAVRRLFARRPWLYWLAVGGLAAWAAALVDGHATALDAARADWGRPVPVLVAARPLAPGDPLAGAYTAVDWPAALAPAGAAEPPEPGAVARRHVAAGFPLAALDLAAGAGPMALVPAGWVAVPVVESPTSGAAVGDRVQVVSEGVVISPEAIVVGFAGEATLVATPAAVAPLLPLAATTAKLTLLRLP